MGMDVTFHTITPRELAERYLDRLPEIAAGDEGPARQLAAASGLNDNQTADYLNVLRTATKPLDPGDQTEETHGYFICAVQGLFSPFRYARDASLSQLVEDEDTAALMRGHVSTWDDLAPTLPTRANGAFTQNWSAGVVLTPEQCASMLASIRERDAMGAAVAELFGPFLPSLEDTLADAAARGAWLVEATDLIEPDPMSGNVGGVISPERCEMDGLVTWGKIASEQIRAAMEGRQR